MTDRNPVANPGATDGIVHGGLDLGELRRLGVDPDRVLDFSTNVNPFGPIDAVRRAIATAPPDRYPDRDCLALREALARHHDRRPAELVVGNGAAELIHLAVGALVRPGERALVLQPAFGEYERALRLARAEVDHLWTVDDPLGGAFTIGTDEVGRGVVARLEREPFRIVFVANPGSPTGDELPSSLLMGWANAWPETLFVVDEAYAPFTGDHTSLAGHRMDNVLVLRSMTKHHALAGVRLGYAIGAEPVIEAVAARRPPWNVSAAAQAAGLAAVAGADAVALGLARLDQERTFLVDGLAALGFEPRPSATPFFLLDVGDASAVRATLLAGGISVRDCGSFGLPGHVRISPQHHEANQRLLDAFGTLPQLQRRGRPREGDTTAPGASQASEEAPPGPPAPGPGEAATASSTAAASAPDPRRGGIPIDPLAETRAAVALLSRIRAKGDGLERTGSAMFPLVGAGLATVAALPAALVSGTAPVLGAALLLAGLATLTGALHLDGLADTADALAAPDPERAEAARRDPRIGAAGAVAIALALLAGVGAIVAIPGWTIVPAAAIAGAASRAVPAIAAVMLRPRTAAETGFGAWFATHSGPGGAGSALALLVAITAGSVVLAEVLAPAGTGAGVPVAAGVAGAAVGTTAGLALAGGLRRRFGRLAGDHFGAAIEASFLTSLAVQAITWGAR